MLRAGCSLPPSAEGGAEHSEAEGVFEYVDEVNTLRYHTQQAGDYATALRHNMTPEERHLWYDFLRYQRPRFHRQMAIGRYIVDFACIKCRLVVELDGGQHYETLALAYDEERTAFLHFAGYRVLRFINSDVKQHFREVCETIERAMQESSIEGRINSQ